MTGTVHEDQYAFMIIFLSVLLRMRNVSDRCCKDNQNNILRSVSFFNKFLPFMILFGKKKYCRAGQVTGVNVAHSLCMLNN